MKIRIGRSNDIVSLTVGASTSWSYSRPLAVFFFRAEQVLRYLIRLKSRRSLFLGTVEASNQPTREIAISSQIGNSLRSVKPRGRSVTLPTRRYSSMLAPFFSRPYAQRTFPNCSIEGKGGFIEKDQD
ncbi:hypothetical protein M0802_013700 [Mischocyttarus mexicanus]|nr:hypothetical protein M0802_013855 [Mischocyttarus mexicanus]KAI4482452.1 hypothetical protein M0802_013700 [Mischocyttarus mexicanus]